MARLTYEEKFKIMSGVLGGDTIETIANNLSRREIAIKTYVTDELPQFIAELSKKTQPVLEVEDTNTAELEAVKKELEELKTKLIEKEQTTANIEFLPEIVLETIIKLKRDGIKEEDAKNALRIVASKINERIDDPARLRILCLREMNLHQSIITSAVGGQSGVTAMTQAASQIADHKKTQHKAGSRTTVDPYIFRPKTGDVI